MYARIGKNKIKMGLVFLLALIFMSGVFLQFNIKVKAQEPINKGVSAIENLTLQSLEDYDYKDWKQTTIDYLNYVFDESNVYTGSNGDTGNSAVSESMTKKIARFTTSANIDAYFEESGQFKAWSIPSYIGYKQNDSDLGEGIAVLSAILSGCAVGLDMHDYTLASGEKYNFIKSSVAYYQVVTGQKFISNGANDSMGSSFWYELLPNVLFAGIASYYSDTETYTGDILTQSAKTWYNVVKGLGGASADFYYTSYKLDQDKPYFNGSHYEPDSAAGMAYILYSAYNLNMNLKKSGQTPFATDAEMEDFLQGAIWCMDYLERIDFSPYYEVLTVLAPYIGARLNFEHGKNYNVSKMIDWTLNNTSRVRDGWAMINENWGGVFTSGIMGSVTDGGGYAFLMNTFDAMLGFSPMLKYDTRYAQSMGKWILAVSQSAKAFYPEMYSNDGQVVNFNGKQVWQGKNQSGKWISQSDSKASFIGYEGLRKTQKSVYYNEKGERNSKNTNLNSPYASGDAFTYNWGGHTDYGLYGSSHVGLFGGSIFKTNVDMILRTDLNTLDMFATNDLQYNLYYNPYDDDKQINVTLKHSTNALYNTITKEYMSISGGTITIPANSSVITVELGSSIVVKDGSNYKYGDIIIAQDRSIVDYNLYSQSESGQLGSKIEEYSEIQDTVIIKTNNNIASGVNVNKFTVLWGNKVLYTSSQLENTIEINTKDIKNGSYELKVVVEFDNAQIETVVHKFIAMNIVKENVLTYVDSNDMTLKWQEATNEWNSLYPTYDHKAKLDDSGEGVKVSVPAGYSFSFATSELFYLDFTRNPIIEFESKNLTGETAIKIYVEGMDNKTGEYIIKDTTVLAQNQVIDVYNKLKEADPTFTADGVRKVSFKVCVRGAVGDSIVITSLSAYHLYAMPDVTEPDAYSWGHYFPSSWLSLWNEDSNFNPKSFEYLNSGEVKIIANETKGAIVSSYIAADMTQNPVVEISLVDLIGTYFVGIKIQGINKVYMIAEDVASSEMESYEIPLILKQNYPDETFASNVSIQIIIGAEKDSTVSFNYVSTYYKLPSWGDTIKNDAWLDYGRVQATEALQADTVLDAQSGLFSITNKSSGVTTYAGVSYKLTTNIDKNPWLDIVVQSLSQNSSHRWRITINETGSSKYYDLTTWTTKVSRYAQSFDVRSMFNGALRGFITLDINIEVYGANSSVVLSKVDTYYKKISPEFGVIYKDTVASWVSEINSAYVSVQDDNKVRVLQKSSRDIVGIVTPKFSTLLKAYPVIAIKLDKVGEDTNVYFDIKVNGIEYRLNSKAVTKAGTYSYDVYTLIQDYSLDNLLTNAELEISADCETKLFEYVIESIEFTYRLDTVKKVEFNKESNYISFYGVDGGIQYEYIIKNVSDEQVGNGVIFESDSNIKNEIDLSLLGLAEGIYNIYITSVNASLNKSNVLRIAFMQGDVSSINLDQIINYKQDGLKISWQAVDYVTEYEYILTDSDSGKTITSGKTTKTNIDLNDFGGLLAFNHNLQVKAVGDGIVYISSNFTEYNFYPKDIQRNAPKYFTTMNSVNNGAYAEYDESNDLAVIKISNSGNWGNIAANEIQLNFDNSPVLYIDFDSSSVGGYYVQIEINGQVYYLTNDTFNFKTVYLDINQCLLDIATNKLTENITGVKFVKILYGATAGTVASTPLVKIKESYVYEMTKGKGNKNLGELSQPILTLENKVVKWDNVENATEYIVTVKNFVGALPSVTITQNYYDLSYLTAEDDYTIEVVARAEKYYDSLAGSIIYKYNGANESNNKTNNRLGLILGLTIPLGVLLMGGAVVAIVILNKRKNKGQ